MATAAPSMSEKHAVALASQLLDDLRTTRAYADREVFTLSPHEAIYTADALMRASGVRHLPLVEDGALVGVVSTRDTGAVLQDAASETAGDGAATPMSPVGDLVRRAPVTIGPDELLRLAARRMADLNVGCLPIVDDSGQLIGVITRQDLAIELADQVSMPPADEVLP